MKNGRVLHARGRRQGRHVAQARRRLRRRRERGLLVEGRRDDLLQRRRPRDDATASPSTCQKDAVRQITSEKAALSVSRDEDTGVVLINYSDGATPPTLFTAPSVEAAGDPRQLETADRREPAGPPVRPRRPGGVHLDVEGREDGRRRARQAGRLPGRPALPAHRRDSRRAGFRRRPPVQRRLRRAGLRGRGLRRAAAELPRLHELRRGVQATASSATTSPRASTTS